MSDNEGFEISSFSKGRVEALTDGIFAIAMTILVLNLDIPPIEGHRSDAQMRDALLKVFPNLLAYIASFVTLGMYWVSHHSAFRFLEKSDRTVLWLNMYFLMFVCLVPFTTGLYAGDADSTIANTIFGANLIIVGLLAYAMWAYAQAKGFIAKEVTPEVRGFLTRRILTAPCLAALALPLSLFQPVWAEAVYFGMVPIFMISVRRFDIPWSFKNRH